MKVFQELFIRGEPKHLAAAETIATTLPDFPTLKLQRIARRSGWCLRRHSTGH